MFTAFLNSQLTFITTELLDIAFFKQTVLRHTYVITLIT